MVTDLDRDLKNRFINYLDNKQYKRLQFEVDMMGDIENQHPLVIFYYASSIYLQKTSKNKDLLYASSLFKKVYLLKKSLLQPLYNMIVISFKTKVFKEVMKLALEAYKDNKDDVKLIEGLARIHFYLGNRKDSLELFRTLFKLLPEKTEGRFPFVSSLNYTSGVFQEEYMEECLNFSKVVEKKIDLEKNIYKFEKKQNSKIKLCFLSADFKRHSVSYFLTDLLKKFDKTLFEISLLSNLKITEQDDLSTKLKKSVNNWHDVEEYSDQELTTFARSLNIDILIDLSGFTKGNRFEALARRCAKIQIGWLGYNNSLGIKNLDYLISDKNLIKPNELDLYTEQILFLPKIWNALSPPEILPEINNDERSKNSNFVFCSFNNFQKLSDETINVWSTILKNDNSELLLKDSLDGGEDLRNNIINKFLKNGVKKDQLIILGREKNNIDHLKLYNKANLALDTFPYPGVTTSFEAILMGLPVLTMKGFNFNSRCGESILKNVKLDNFIANDSEDYIKKAKDFKNNNNFENHFGLKLREKAINSPLFDTEKFSVDFQNLMKEIFKKI